MQENSFSYVGPQLYNSIPNMLRRKYENIDPVGTFKSQLDNFLMYVPDEPTVQGRVRRANSNSLIHQIDYYCDTEIIWQWNILTMRGTTVHGRHEPTIISTVDSWSGVSVREFARLDGTVG